MDVGNEQEPLWVCSQEAADAESAILELAWVRPPALREGDVFPAVSHLTYTPNVLISHSCEGFSANCQGMLPTVFAERNKDAEWLASLTPTAKRCTLKLKQNKTKRLVFNPLLGFFSFKFIFVFFYIATKASSPSPSSQSSPHPLLLRCCSSDTGRHPMDISQPWQATARPGTSSSTKAG